MLKTLQTLPLLLAFTLLGHLALAQGTIKGTVTTDEGATLPGASVLIKGTTIGTVTDAEGEFSLSGVEAGKQTVEVSFIGYGTVATPITVKSNATVNLGNIVLSPDNIQLESVEVAASFVRDRYTPVAVSTIQPYVISERLGTQEFPEILKTTPSVYATKSGGGYGDSRIYLRGFDSNNIGVLINGVPVNDMESGKVYWSNWAGLSDVTQSQQVQRGLGASKLAISSVGGTINILTKSAEPEAGGDIYYGVGNDGYQKKMFTVSTGMLDNGWALTMSGSHVYGDGYVQATNYEGWSYFINVAKIINDQHRITFTAFGAPQTHNQRNNKHYIQSYRENQMGAKWNSDWGYRNGEIYGGPYAYNYYHKPQLSLNHTWTINDHMMLSTQLYGSKSFGGGRRVSGVNAAWLSRSYPAGEATADTKLTPEGYYDYDWVINANSNTIDGESECFIANSVNQHDWYGLLPTLTIDLLPLKLTFGLDSRFYRGYHYMEIDDLLGGEYYSASHLVKGDKFSYFNLGDVIWNGLFGQAEYIADKYSGFVSLSVAQKSYRRIDYFQYTGDDQISEWVNYLPWNVKGGFNYKITDQHNVYINAGLVNNAPNFSNTFRNNTNVVNENIKYEKIQTLEFGYGFNTSKVEVKAGYYFTKWLERAFVKSLGNNETALLTGLNALHQGFESEITYKPGKKLTLRGMLSIGDWIWTNDAKMTIYDANQVYKGESPVYIANVHVGNSAQNTASLSFDYEILKKLKIGSDMVYYGKNFADYEPTNRVTENDAVDAWQLPDAFIIDINANYKFKIGNLNASLYGKLNNLLDTEYITDATDGAAHDMNSALVWYGFGRNWSTGLKVTF